MSGRRRIHCVGTSGRVRLVSSCFAYKAICLVRPKFPTAISSPPESAMLTSLLIILPFVLVGSAQKILLTNDDGWAVAQIRAQFNALEASKYIVRVSTPRPEFFVPITFLALVSS